MDVIEHSLTVNTALVTHCRTCAAAERRWHVVVPLVLSALAMCALAAFMSSHAGLAFAALMVTGAPPDRRLL